MKNNKGFVYLIMDNSKDNTYKIGMTKGTIEKRIKELQTGNSTELAICRYYQTDKPYFLEKKLHHRYQDKQILNEWYELDENDVFTFEETCSKIETMINALQDNPFLPKNLK